MLLNFRVKVVLELIGTLLAMLKERKEVSSWGVKAGKMDS